MKIFYTPPFGTNVQVTLGSPYPAHPGDNLQAVVNGNTQFNGTGSLSGTVRVKGSIAPNSKVYLYEESTRFYVGERTSDSLGKFLFEGLNINKKYFIVAIDPTSEFEYRISSRRIPVEV